MKQEMPKPLPSTLPFSFPNFFFFSYENLFLFHQKSRMKPDTLDAIMPYHTQLKKPKTSTTIT